MDFLFRLYWLIDYYWNRNNYKNKLEVPLPIKTTNVILPSRTVYYNQEGKNHIVVVKLEKGRRTIFFNDGCVSLYFPDSYFIVKATQCINPDPLTNGKFSFVNLSFGFSEVSLTSTGGSLLFPFPLPNYHGYPLEVCLGFRENILYNNLKEVVDFAINLFWSTKFTGSSEDVYIQEWKYLTDYNFFAVKKLLMLKSCGRNANLFYLLGDVEEPFYDYKYEPKKPKKSRKWKRKQKRLLKALADSSNFYRKFQEKIVLF